MAETTSHHEPVAGPHKGLSPVARALRPWLTFKALFGVLILVSFILSALLAPYLAPFDPNKQDLMRAMIAPQWLAGPHVFGTDHVGRDLLSRLIYGARISLSIAASVVVISGAVGIFLGTVSGYFGGRIDFLIQKVVEMVGPSRPCSSPSLFWRSSARASATSYWPSPCNAGSPIPASCALRP